MAEAEASEGINTCGRCEHTVCVSNLWIKSSFFFTFASDSLQQRALFRGKIYTDANTLGFCCCLIAFCQCTVSYSCCLERINQQPNLHKML